MIVPNDSPVAGKEGTLLQLKFSGDVVSDLAPLHQIKITLLLKFSCKFTQFRVRASLLRELFLFCLTTVYVRQELRLN